MLGLPDCGSMRPLQVRVGSEPDTLSISSISQYSGAFRLECPCQNLTAYRESYAPSCRLAVHCKAYAVLHWHATLPSQPMQSQ